MPPVALAGGSLTWNPGIFVGPVKLLGGSGVVVSRVISRVTILITHIKGPKTLLITTPESPSRGDQNRP